MDDEQDPVAAALEAALRTRAHLWARRVRRIGWSVALTVASLAAGALALLR